MESLPTNPIAGMAQSASLKELQKEVLAYNLKATEPMKMDSQTCQEALLRLTIPIKASGRIKASDDEILLMVTDLAEKLHGYNAADVLEAFEKHQKSSPFFPDLSDLMKFIQPRIDHRIRMAEYERRNRPWIPDGANSNRGDFQRLAITTGLQDEPQEVRTAAVASWKDGGAQKLMDAGIEAERLRGGTKTSEKPKIDSKDQPWHDVNELRASALRINAMTKLWASQRLSG